MTAWAPKILRRIWVVVVVSLLFVVGRFLWGQRTIELIYLDKKPILVEIASTAEERQQGLSDRRSLPQGHGMLFTFDKPAASCMWMKDMNFPLDVYWFTESGNLISAVKNLSPASYPSVYCPNSAASYMLEVNSGELSFTPSLLTPPPKQ